MTGICSGVTHGSPSGTGASVGPAGAEVEGGEVGDGAHREPSVLVVVGAVGGRVGRGAEPVEQVGEERHDVHAVVHLAVDLVGGVAELAGPPGDEHPLDRGAQVGDRSRPLDRHSALGLDASTATFEPSSAARMPAAASRLVTKACAGTVTRGGCPRCGR